MSNIPEVQKVEEGTGATINAAIEAVLKRINKDRDDVTVEIIDKPRSGFLGIGASPARVRVSYYEPAPEPEEKPARPQPQIRPQPQPQKARLQPLQPKPKARTEDQPPVPAQKAQSDCTSNQKTAGQAEKKSASVFVPAHSEASRKAREFISGLLPYFGITAGIDVKEDSDGNISMELLGDSMGVIIGRRGDTLDAMQYLCSLVVNRGEDKHYRILIDTENYRAKREESLVRLARKIAGKVIKYKKSMTLEPMNPYERRIIHSALQDYRGITTYSTGSEPNRRIVVTLAGAQKNSGQSVRRNSN